jgi:DNA polymerase zeta
VLEITKKYKFFKIKSTFCLFFCCCWLGQKTCLHVHNVFPYLLVRSSKLAFADADELNRHMFEFSNQIDKILNVSLGVRDPIASQHVFKIEPCQTKSMYGFHGKDSLFFKIYLYRPDVIKK